MDTLAPPGPGRRIHPSEISSAAEGEGVQLPACTRPTQDCVIPNVFGPFKDSGALNPCVTDRFKSTVHAVIDSPFGDSHTHIARVCGDIHASNKGSD